MPPLIETTIDVEPREGDESVSFSLPILVVIGLATMSTVWVVVRWWSTGRVENLEEHIEALDTLVNENSSYKEDLLGEAGPAYKQSLRKIYSEVETLKKAKEYHEALEMYPITRAIHLFYQLYETGRCKRVLRMLESDIKARVQAEKAHRVSQELAELRARSPRY
ncbi:hypothetical protein V5O48_006720 [Marasmius crinis-equi]|uniref:Uncharacterized protein n=1 Tax=Marasmius crinis-equi TaxID=585013 RepID=A0ABR3FIR5_9AGAR